jgi:cupin 2 domain-containing protein
MSVPSNLFQAIPATLPDEWMERLAAGDGLTIERIVSRGHASADSFWYDQDRHEFVVLLSGAARLEFADGEDEVELVAGDWLVIPAHRRHRVAWTDPERESVWLAVHFSGEPDG